MASPRDDDPRPRPKGLDAVIAAAFRAGVQHGTGYPTYDSIPPEQTFHALMRFKEKWNASGGAGS